MIKADEIDTKNWLMGSQSGWLKKHFITLSLAIKIMIKYYLTFLFFDQHIQLPRAGCVSRPNGEGHTFADVGSYPLPASLNRPTATEIQSKINSALDSFHHQKFQ